MTMKQSVVGHLEKQSLTEEMLGSTQGLSPTELVGHDIAWSPFWSKVVHDQRCSHLQGLRTHGTVQLDCYRGRGQAETAGTATLFFLCFFFFLRYFREQTQWLC